MRFGVCAGVELAGVIATAGYDYIELSVAADLTPESSESEWTTRRRGIDEMPLRPEAFNSFVRTGKIVGPDADPERLRRYVQTALSRAAQVGGSVIVFGSGGARFVPEGFPRDVARGQLIDFLSACADASDTTGVTVAVEPLEHAECNCVNLVSEAVALAAELNRAGVQVLADTYHMEQEGEPLTAIPAAGDRLIHAHTADTNRLAPGAGHYDHTAFFGALLATGYDRRVSIECAWGASFADEARTALAHLQAAFRQARAGA